MEVAQSSSHETISVDLQQTLKLVSFTRLILSCMDSGHCFMLSIVKVVIEVQSIYQPPLNCINLYLRPPLVAVIIVC